MLQHDIRISVLRSSLSVHALLLEINVGRRRSEGYYLTVKHVSPSVQSHRRLLADSESWIKYG